MDDPGRKTVTALVPKYVSDFRCIAKDCEDTCCIGFDKIVLDSSTYERYESANSLGLRTHIDRLTPGTEAEFGRICMGPANRCPFLLQSGLCAVQSELGEEALSFTCASYPRIYNLVLNRWECSLSPACPEAARLVLLNAAGIEFVEREIVPVREKGSFHKHLPLSANDAELRWHFPALRGFTLDLLGNRALSLSDRLIALSLFFAKVEEAKKRANCELVPSLIEAFRSEIASAEFCRELGSLPGSAGFQLSLLNYLLEQGLVHSGLPQRYQQAFSECLMGIGFRLQVPADELLANYQSAYLSFYKPFEAERGYLLENYLRNRVFQTVFPFGLCSSVMDETLLLVLMYAMVRLHLIGLAAHDKGLTDSRAVMMIQCLSKSIEHGEEKLAAILRLIKDKGWSSPAHLAALVRN